MELCPCGSNTAFSKCCRPVIDGKRPAATAEELMRSRYSAYVKKEIGYIGSSLHPDFRSDYDEASTRQWAEGAKWLAFEIVETKGGGKDDEAGEVEFIVAFEEKGLRREHRELSSFKKHGGTWYFTEGKMKPSGPVVRVNPKIGRNDPCGCGSGKKFKKCCGQ